MTFTKGPLPGAAKVSNPVLRRQAGEPLKVSNPNQLTQFALTVQGFMLKLLALGLLTKRTYVRLKTEFRRYFEAFSSLFFFP